MLSPSLQLAPMARQTRVIIADPHPVILHGVRKMVEDDARFTVVAEVSTMLSFRKKLVAAGPEVALVDWSMASQDLAATRALLQSEVYQISTVFMTASEDALEKQKMLRLGPCGVLSKWTSTHKLQMAVLKASNARTRLEAPTGQAVYLPPRPIGDPVQLIERLTQRERQILPLVCGGLRNKEIAVELGIAESTVWHHLTAVFTKLQVEDRMGLAAFAYGHHLVHPQQ